VSGRKYRQKDYLLASLVNRAFGVSRMALLLEYVLIRAAFNVRPGASFLSMFSRCTPIFISRLCSTGESASCLRPLELASRRANPLARRSNPSATRALGAEITSSSLQDKRSLNKSRLRIDKRPDKRSSFDDGINRPLDRRQSTLRDSGERRDASTRKRLKLSMKSILINIQYTSYKVIGSI